MRRTAGRNGSLPLPQVPEGGGPVRLAERVSAQIEHDIIEAGWPIGTVFGSEIDLCERYGVSRAVLREAVRLLEHHQVARMRRGVGGGLVVTEPEALAVTDAMAVYLRYQGVGAGDLMAARRTIELDAVQAAAEQMTEEGIVQLRAHLAEEQAAVVDPDYEEPSWNDFHILVADLSGNPAFGLFTRCMVSLVQQAYVVPEPWQQAIETCHQSHSEIAEALIAGDAALARYRMGQHLESLADYVPTGRSEREPADS